MPSLSFAERARADEWMDDASVAEDHLREALQNLQWINRWLGGYRASYDQMAPLLDARASLRVLDVGTGGGDYLPEFVRWGQAAQCSVTAVGVDLNPVTAGYGRAWLDATLPPAFRDRARIDIGDALALPYPDNAFDVGHAALFLHHLYDESARLLLQELDRVSRLGILINDLHRHPLAFAGIWTLARLLQFSPMVQHDGPLSVRRGFHRADLQALASRARLSSPRIRWHWAFRWTLSSLPSA
ncbi:MAG: methyltransferase domain-containing protein [Salinibacter sp.]